MVDPNLYLKGGVIPEQDNEHYIIRLRVPAGILAVEALAGIAKIAKKYGIADTHLTTRQTIELLHVNPDVLDKLLHDLEKNGTPIGAERNEIVNITACLGNANCKYSVIDTLSLAKKLDEKHFGKEMPVKVRIAISGCPNGCTSERLNEIGITGLRRPVRNEGLCTGCGTCGYYCREHAIIIENGRLRLNQGECMLCGFCIHACPFQYINFEDPLYLITLGGRRGRHPKIGRTFYIARTEDDVVEIVGKIVYWIFRSVASGKMLPEQLTDEEFAEFREKVVRSLKPLGIEGVDPTNAYCIQQK